ncbi:ABC transporter ATP-binding protein [Devosia ginsengisoli]|uniref:ABC transporter ATP-binding protein n=1 Tax=Devosia ginsengisoli TaxID=400770 RepID=UPI0026EFB6D9|nr:ABC transporter ATP-binding protein [Devosia ginsengisoli]MCR6672040.1 ABC transporter ATP-binding protein/permease [Devosia ginsengisoli]
MLLETAGIGLFIPALALMTEPDVGSKYPALQPFLDYVGEPTPIVLITWGLSLLIAVYIFKNLYLAFLAWWQAKFVFDVQADLSRKLFAGYLNQPYTFHLARNSAELIRNATGEVMQFTVRTLLPMMTLATEGLVLVGVSLLLLLVEPLGALVVILVLGGSGAVFYLAFRSRLISWGQERLYHDGQRIQHLQQGLGGAKDVILLGREDEFLRSYDVHNVQVARYGHMEHVLQSVPRLFLESLAVTGIAVLILTMLAQGRSIESLIPTVGLFGAAAFRVMPIANRVLGSIQRLRFSLPVVAVLHREMSELQPSTRAAKAIANPIESDLTVKDISYTYTGAARTAVHDINLTIRKGTSVGLVGESGSGKSTLVDIMLGLLSPTEGQVLLDGKDIRENLRGWQNQIGYVAQSIYLTDDTLRRNIAFGLADEDIDEAAIDRALAAAQLQDFVAGLPEGKQTIFGERGVRLSGGQLQRIGIARALYHDPHVLVLDEATSALDAGTERGVMEAIEALHGTKTIIIIAHRLSTVEHCDELIRLDQGRVVRRGTFAEVTRAS